MSIVFICDGFTFPEGDAPTNRVHGYGKGFIEHNINVHVICIENIYDSPGSGVVNGIYYYHPFGRGKRNKYFIARTLRKLVKYFRTYFLFREINRNDKVGAIIAYTALTSTYAFSWFLARISGSKMLNEMNEHPMKNFQSGSFSVKRGKTKFRIEAFLSDGILLISKYLMDFYKENGIKQHRMLLVPSTVDPSRFSATGQRPLSFPYIGYFGGLTFRRDNVDILIEAFSRITNKYPEYHLVLGGFCTPSEKQQIERLIFNLNLSPKVTLLKYLPREEIIRYITHSEVLVMVRSKNLDSQASFPSKLTEYLATSRPVITVNVGDISDYLTDNVNSFLIEPGNTAALAEKMDFVLGNYEFARQVGARGKELTSSVFNYKVQAEKLISFIDHLYAR